MVTSPISRSFGRSTVVHAAASALLLSVAAGPGFARASLESVHAGSQATRRATATPVRLAAGEPIYDEFGLVPESTEGELFLPDPVLDPSWPAVGEDRSAAYGRAFEGGAGSPLDAEQGGADGGDEPYEPAVRDGVGDALAPRVVRPAPLPSHHDGNMERDPLGDSGEIERDPLLDLGYMDED